MKLWVLDTDTLTLMSFQHPGVTTRALLCPPESVTVSIVTVEETFIGRYNKIQQARRQEDVIAAYQELESSVKLLRALPILPFDVAAASKFAELRNTYRRLGTKDLRIAAIALSHNATVVTCNTADFGQIEGLQFEDWS